MGKHEPKAGEFRTADGVIELTIHRGRVCDLACACTPLFSARHWREREDVRRRRLSRADAVGTVCTETLYKQDCAGYAKTPSLIIQKKPNSFFLKKSPFLFLCDNNVLENLLSSICFSTTESENEVSACWMTSQDI
jgi:hypothetical protein